MANATLVILNPKAGGGRAGRLWSKLEPLMYQALGDLVVAITERPAQVGDHLEEARRAGLTRIIAVGGDGTSHAIVNALMKMEAQYPGGEPFILGQLPIGTGQDFARSLNIPTKPEDAVRWLASVQAHPIDIGQLDFGGERRYFLNIASAGVSGEVDQRVQDVKRYPWTFWLATVRSFLTYQQPRVRVQVDGEMWYEGRIWLVVVANGSRFGRGMAIAPDAKVDDGLFEVILVKEASRLTAIRAFNTVYSGRHLLRDEVDARRGKTVSIECLENDPLPLDLDGEPESGNPLQFSLKPAALQMLCDIS